MRGPALITVQNLTEFHYSQYPDPETDPPTVERLQSGDWCLTRTSTDGTVTFIEIIDQHTGEFQSTARQVPAK